MNLLYLLVTSAISSIINILKSELVQGMHGMASKIIVEVIYLIWCPTTYVTAIL